MLSPINVASILILSFLLYFVFSIDISFLEFSGIFLWVVVACYLCGFAVLFHSIRATDPKFVGLNRKKE